jgi:RNA polymerase primary sigma factor
VSERVPPHTARLRRYLKLVRRSRSDETREGGAARSTSTQSDPAGSVDLEALILPRDAAISRKVREEIRTVLNMLTPREAEVVRMRFGIGDTRDHLPEEIAKRLALSRQRIFSIQVEALRKLRRPRSRHLQPVIRT